MSRLAAIAGLTVLWAAVTGGFALPNLLLGAVLAGLVTYLLRDRAATPGIWRRLRAALSLAGLFFYELMVSAVRVALLVLTPRLDARLKPAIVAFPLSVTRDAEIALLANLITLTPGTLSVDVSEDKRFLFVHALTVEDRQALIAEIASGFEARVKAVFA